MYMSGLCWHRAVFITVVLRYNLMSGMATPPAVFLSPGIDLAILVALWSFVNFNSFSISVKNGIKILIDVTLNP